ncbi:MAG: hypothetical protein D3903_09730 [Candidatus Electrothrix sp. GM3_4]|nr:hypothetical protein [Candidatus Electrothrix sp. GM3_4]
MIRVIRKNNETLQIGTLQDRPSMESAAPFAGYEATVVCLRRFMHDAYNMTVLRKVLYEDSYQFGVHSLSDQEVISQVARKAVRGQIFIARGKAAQYGGGSSSPSVKEVVQAEGKKWSKKDYVQSFLKENESKIDPAVPDHPIKSVKAQLDALKKAADSGMPFCEICPYDNTSN